MNVKCSAIVLPLFLVAVVFHVGYGLIVRKVEILVYDMQLIYLIFFYRQKFNAIHQVKERAWNLTVHSQKVTITIQLWLVMDVKK